MCPRDATGAKLAPGLHPHADDLTIARQTSLTSSQACPLNGVNKTTRILAPGIPGACSVVLAEDQLSVGKTSAA